MTNRDLPPVRLGYEVDSASEARIKASTQQFVAQLKEMADSGKGVDASTQRLTRQVIAEFEKQNSAVKASVASQVSELKKLEAGFDNTGEAAKRGLKIESLRRTGGALSQLGAGEIGGAVSRAGDIGQIAKEAGELIAALGPLAPVMAGVAVAVIGLNIELKDSEQQLQKSSNQLKQYYQLITDSTTKSLQEQIRLAKIAKQNAEDEVATREKALKAAQPQEGESGLQQFVKVVAQTRPEFQKLQKDLDDAKQRAQEADDKLKAANRALGSTNVKLNDFADTLNDKTAKALKFVTDLSEKYAKAQAEVAAALRAAGDKEIERIKVEQRTNNELLSFTYEQAQARIKSIEDEKAINDKIILTRGLANAQLDRNSDEYKRNAVEMAAATEANKNLNLELNNLKNGLDNLPTEIDAANQRLATITQKFNDEQASIQKRSLEERANIESKYHDKLIDIARNTANAMDEAARNLERQTEDNAISFDRAGEKAERDAAAKQQDIQLKAQQDEAKALKQHVVDLERIRQEAADREFDLILNRDFLGLFQSRRQTSRDMERANQDFTGQAEDRRVGMQQQFDDLRRSIARERQERIIAANQQLEDNRRTYQRSLQDEQRKRQQEIQLANEARTKDLQNLSSKTAAELRFKQQSYDAELRMAALYGRARVDAEAATQRALLAQANARLAALTSGASGGTFMTQNTTNNSTRSIQVNASGYGVNEVTQQILKVVRQLVG